MDTINDRLECICSSLFNGNKSAMAKAIGLQPTGLSNYLGNKRRSKPNVDMIANLVQFCRIDAFWLLTGEGEMLSTDNSQRSVAVVSSTISENSVVANKVNSLAQEPSSELPILRERVAALERLLAEKERLIQLYESMNKPPKSGTETGQ